MSVSIAAAGTIAVIGAGMQIAYGTFPGLLLPAIPTLMGLPTAVRSIRGRPPSVRIDDDECAVEHDGVFSAPLTIRRAELHSIVPVWLGPPRVSPVRVGSLLPIVGDPGGHHAPALVLVLREERLLHQARSRLGFRGTPRNDRPVRGIALAVDDLDEAQGAFQSWGLLARLTPDAFEWLAPRSKASSPDG